MKELSIEEKAQRYDETLERAKAVIEQNPLMEYLKKGIEYIFPELKESKDEKIRKVIYGWIYTQPSQFFDSGFSKEEMLAWLEKQGEQKPAFEMITPEESLGIDSDTYNKIVGECLYGEQKPADKVEPKFKQGDIIKEKETGNLFYVNSVEEFGYTLHYKNCIAKGCTMDFKYEDNYELVEQNPAWSEEDEKILNLIIARLHSHPSVEVEEYGKDYHWFKSIKDRYTWKPSDKELGALLVAIGDERQESSDVAKELLKIYHHLKKLKG